jgi:hypothetical protein
MLKQFTPHLRQVVWPHNFKLEKFKKYDGKENPKNQITLYEIAIRSVTGDEQVMASYFLVILDEAKNYADADNTEKLFREDVRGNQQLDHPPW